MPFNDLYSACIAVPVLGDLRISNVAPIHNENLLQQKLASGLSPKTVLNLVALLQCIFSVAEDNDLIARSPVRRRHKPLVQKRETIWTASQVRLILESVPAPYRALFAAAALTGARLGEPLALQRKHIDQSQRKLKIEQRIWHRKIVLPKTASSVRTIHFGDGLGQAERIGNVRLPYVQAFCGELRQFPNGKSKTLAEVARARHDRHHGRDLYAHHARRGASGCNCLGACNLRGFVPESVPNWEQFWYRGSKLNSEVNRWASATQRKRAL